MEVMAIFGFICLLGLGLYLLLAGGAAVIGLTVFTGELLTPLLALPVTGVVLIYLACHWAPFSISVAITS